MRRHLCSALPCSVLLFYASLPFDAVGGSWGDAASLLTPPPFHVPSCYATLLCPLRGNLAVTLTLCLRRCSKLLPTSTTATTTVPTTTNVRWQHIYNRCNVPAGARRLRHQGVPAKRGAQVSRWRQDVDAPRAADGEENVVATATFAPPAAHLLDTES